MKNLLILLMALMPFIGFSQSKEAADKYEEGKAKMEQTVAEEAAPVQSAPQVAVVMVQDGEILDGLDGLIDSTIVDSLLKSKADIGEAVKRGHEIVKGLPKEVNTKEDFYILLSGILALLSFVIMILAQYFPKVRAWANSRKRFLAIGIGVVLVFIASQTVFKGDLSLKDAGLFVLTLVLTTGGSAFVFDTLNKWNPANPFLQVVKTALLLGLNLLKQKDAAKAVAKEA